MPRAVCDRSHRLNYGRFSDDVKDVNVHAADPGRRATIRDVASRAGVSHQTVSRVINLNPNVAEHTRERVLAAIRELGYVPSPMARGLISNRTRSLGVVADDISDGFFARMVAGAEAEARRRGYYLMIGSVEPDDDERGYLRLMLERRVEGLILARPSVPLAPGDLEPARSAGVPLVGVGASELPGFPIVDVDNEQGGYDATRHLLEHGHERIAIITGPLGSTPGKGRFEGFSEALGEAGIELAAEYAQSSDFRRDGGYQAMLQLLGLAKPPTAVFVTNNLMTIGALHALHDVGVQVPEQLSIIGFDDLDLADLLAPPLTVVDRPMEGQGVLAMRLLLSRLDGTYTGEPRRIVLETRLLKRGSCSGPSGSARNTDVVAGGAGIGSFQEEEAGK
jgi:LacI family transcriptional regulator